jgi:serine/threonine-protein kinase
MIFENLVGQTLGQYRLIGLLGQGGMGAVYHAIQTSLDRAVALKVMSPTLAEQPGYLERFNREARLAAGLQHPHIVTIHDFGAVGNIMFVVMQLLTGGSLEQRMRARPGAPPSLGEAVELLSGIASALDYAHQRGVIHRDIKPANIMFDERGKAYLVDFGIAKLLEGSSDLTGTGMALGSPSYMPPEQWRGEQAHPASDQYALAVTIYNMLSGRMPFEADTPHAMMHKHIYDPPTPIYQVRPDLPVQTMMVLGRALQKDVKERWPSCSEFAAALKQSAIGFEGEATNFFAYNLPKMPPARTSAATPPISPPPASTPTPTLTPPGPIAPRSDAPPPAALRRSRLPILVGGLVVVTLAALGVGALMSGAPPPASPTNEPPTETFSPRQIALVTREAQATLDAEFTALAAIDQTATAALFTATPTATQTDTPTHTATATFTATYTPTRRPTETATFTASPTRTPRPTNTPRPTLTPSRTPRPTNTARPTLTPSRTPRPTNTPRPTLTPSRTPRPTNTPRPTLTPSLTPRPTNTPRPTSIPRATATPVTKARTSLIARLFHQNFAADARGVLRQLGPAWSLETVKVNGIDNQVYCNVGRPHNENYDLLFWGNPAWTDYIVELDVRFNNLGLVEVYGRYEGSTANLYAYRGYANSKDGSASMGYYGPRSVDLGGQNFRFVRNRWYTLRMEFDGRRIRYWVDNTLIANRIDSSRSSGYAGFLVHAGTSVCIDNITVWAMERPVNARFASARNAANLRSGPGESFAIVDVLAAREGVIVIGRNRDGSWLRVRSQYGAEAWVAARLMNLSNVMINALTVITP